MILVVTLCLLCQWITVHTIGLWEPAQGGSWYDIGSYAISSLSMDYCSHYLVDGDQPKVASGIVLVLCMKNILLIFKCYFTSCLIALEQIPSCVLCQQCWDLLFN